MLSKQRDYFFISFYINDKTRREMIIILVFPKYPKESYSMSAPFVIPGLELVDEISTIIRTDAAIAPATQYQSSGLLAELSLHLYHRKTINLCALISKKVYTSEEAM